MNLVYYLPETPDDAKKGVKVRWYLPAFFFAEALKSELGVGHSFLSWDTVAYDFPPKITVFLLSCSGIFRICRRPFRPTCWTSPISTFETRDPTEASRYLVHIVGECVPTSDISLST